MYKYKFVEISEKNLPVVLDIYNYYVENSTATFHSRPLTEMEMREIVYFEKPVYKTYIILDGDDIQGYVLITPFKKREAYDKTAEITVYLKHDCLGKGAGSEAVKFIESFAAKNGIHVLVAVICSENDESIKLFEKNGYSKCAHYREVGKKFGRLLDVVSYQKILK